MGRMRDHMSGIQFWSPFTYDTRQQGLSNASITTVGSGATINTNGKLGKCYYFDGTNKGYMITDFPTNVGTNDFSITMWLKIPTISSGTYYAICTSKTTSASGVGFGIYWHYGSKRFLWSTADGTNATEIWMADAVDTIVYDKWIHLVMVRDSNDAKKGYFYINGTRYELVSVPAIRDIATVSYLHFGTCTNGAYYTKMYMNDFRIYNRAISAIEAKKLSQALLVHYPLSDSGIESTTNLVTSLTAGTRTTKSADGTSIITNGENADTYFYINTSEAITTNTIYTFSCYVTGASGDSKYAYKINNESSLAFYLKNGYNEYTFSATSSMNNKTQILIDDGTRPETVTSITITNIQLEKKNHATVYAGLGGSRTETTVYDCSGFQNNAVINGSLSVSYDTPKYKYSTFFSDGRSNFTNASIYLGDNKNFTMSLWMKSTDGSAGYSGYHILASVESSQYEMSMSSGGRPRIGFNISGTRNVADYGNINCLDMKWHMITMTYDGNNIKVYIDGENIATTAVSGTLSIGSKSFRIGNYMGTTYGDKNILTSDARIYATALSANDIKQLYDTAASVANNGVLMAYEFAET